MTNLLREFLTRFRRDESGATLVEYGIALFVAITVGGTLLTNLAGTTGDNFESADTAATYVAPEDGGGTLDCTADPQPAGC